MEKYRIVQDVGLYYVTFTMVEWLPVLIDETACKVFIDSLNFCINNKGLVLRPEDGALSLSKGWRFSSALYWLTREKSDVQLSDVGWE